MTGLEALAVLVVSLLLAAVLVSLLSGLFTGPDTPSLDSASSALGQLFPDQGDRLLARGVPDPVYLSNPPTSGPHHAAGVTRQGTTLSNDQLLQALSQGDVVLIYGTPRVPPALAATARLLGGAFTPALARSGLAVILARRPGTRDLLALAWRRMLRASDAGDPRLRSFAEQYLGHGAAG